MRNASKSLGDPRGQRERRFQAGQVIAELIDYYGIARKDIAKETGVHPHTVKSIGQRIPSLFTLDTISAYVAGVARKLRKQHRKPDLTFFSPKKGWARPLSRAVKAPLKDGSVDLLSVHPKKYTTSVYDLMQQVEIRREMEAELVRDVVD